MNAKNRIETMISALTTNKNNTHILPSGGNVRYFAFLTDKEVASNSEVADLEIVNNKIVFNQDFVEQAKLADLNKLLTDKVKVAIADFKFPTKDDETIDFDQVSNEMKSIDAMSILNGQAFNSAALSATDKLIAVKLVADKLKEILLVDKTTAATHYTNFSNFLRTFPLEFRLFSIRQIGIEAIVSNGLDEKETGGDLADLMLDINGQLSNVQ
jgi:hypothetical protein